MTDEEKTHRLYLLLGEQVALGRTASGPLTSEASESVIKAQYEEIQKLRQPTNG